MRRLGSIPAEIIVYEHKVYCGRMNKCVAIFTNDKLAGVKYGHESLNILMGKLLKQKDVLINLMKAGTDETDKQKKSA